MSDRGDRRTGDHHNRRASDIAEIGVVLERINALHDVVRNGLATVDRQITEVTTALREHNGRLRSVETEQIRVVATVATILAIQGEAKMTSKEHGAAITALMADRDQRAGGNVRDKAWLGMLIAGATVLASFVLKGVEIYAKSVMGGS